MLVCVTLFDSKFLDTRLSCLPRTLVKKTITQSPTSGGTPCIWSFPFPPGRPRLPHKFRFACTGCSAVRRVAGLTLLLFPFISADMGPTTGSDCKSMGKPLWVCTQQTVETTLQAAPKFHFMGENLWTGSLSIFCVFSHHSLNAMKSNTIWIQFSEMQQSLWPLHSGTYLTYIL